MQLRKNANEIPSGGGIAAKARVCAIVLALFLAFIPREGYVSELSVDHLTFEQLVAGSPIILVAEYRKTTTVETGQVAGSPYLTDVDTYTLMEVLKNADSKPIASTLEVYPADWRLYRQMAIDYERGLSISPMVERYRADPGVNRRGRVILFLLHRQPDRNRPTFEFAVEGGYESVDRKKEVLNLIRQPSKVAPSY